MERFPEKQIEEAAQVSEEEQVPTGLGEVVIENQNIEALGELDETRWENPDVFADAEREMLSSVEHAEGEEGRASRFRKALFAVTAGVMLMNATPVFAAEKSGEKLTDKETIEQQIQELQEEKLRLEQEERKVHKTERIQELEGYLSGFGVVDLVLKPQKDHRCICEEYDVYVDGKEMGHVMAEKNTFSRHEFMGQVERILVENGIAQPEKRGDYNVFIDYEANKAMKERGWKISGDTIDFGDPKQVLTLDEHTKKVNIGLEKDGDIRIIVEDGDGSITIVTVDEGGKVSRYKR